MSKIKNRTARRKNRVENGIRAEPFGSNPHSKGVINSREFWCFTDRFQARTITIKVINEASLKAIIGFIIGIGVVPYLTSSVLSVRPAQYLKKW